MLCLPGIAVLRTLGLHSLSTHSPFIIFFWSLLSPQASSFDVVRLSTLRSKRPDLWVVPQMLMHNIVAHISQENTDFWLVSWEKGKEGRKGSEEGVPENLSVPLEGDRDFGELCGSHQGCQGPSSCPIRAQAFSCAGCEPVLMLGWRSSLLLILTKKQGWAKGRGRPKAQSAPTKLDPGKSDTRASTKGAQ